MPDHWNILADSDGDIGKLVIGVIALIFWGVSAMVSAAKKRQEQARRRQMFEQIARGGAVPTPPAPPARPAVRPGPSRAMLPPKRPMPAAQAARMTGPPPPAPRRGKSKGQSARTSAPSPLTTAASPIASATTAAGGTESRPAAKAPPVDARALRRWLTPATLRSQFMLTEVLQPPLALREPRE